MQKKISHILAGLSLSLVLSNGSIYAQHPAAENGQILPLDPAVRTGTLANGFTYFIRKNKEPKDRAQLYLVIKTGSIMEDDNQRGLAHFMEHMNFNGTKNFPKNELVNYLEKAGVKFGADLNAYTSFDETVYQLPIPTDDETVFNTGMQIMRDWAQDATLDPEEINKERGVILEEKRLGMGAGERLQRQYLPMLFNHSRYADRLPIGTEEVLINFDPKTILRYKEDWYRPDLQALIVVGDIDVDDVEKKIKTLFSDLKNPAVAKPRTKYSIELSGKNQFMSLTDKEITGIQLQVMIKHKEPELKTAADYKQAILRSLFNQMLSGRFRELLQQANPPFVNANASIGGFLAGLDLYSVNIILKPGQYEQGFKTAWRETERVKQFGFTATELERAKKNYMSNMQSALKEKDKTHSINYVEEYQRYFLSQEAVPGIEYEYKLAKDISGSISLADVNALTVEYISDANRDILLLAPEKEKDNLLFETTFNKWIADVKAEKLTAYVDNESDEPLLTTTLKPGKLVNNKTIPEIDVQQLTLSNGVKVIIKATDFKNDEILFRAFSPGGTSLYSDADFQSAANASGIINSFGVGKFDAIQLQKKLSGKKVGVSPYINERSEGVTGSVTPEDLETALQLIHLYFTQPRKDTTVFQSIIERSKTILTSRYNDPNNVFTDTVNAVLGGYNIRRSGPSVAKLSQIQLDKLYGIYKERFANAGDFTFFFIGNIDVNTIRPLLEKYLGSLPSTNKKETATNLGILPLAGKVEKTVYKGTENKASVRIVYNGSFKFNQSNILALNALGKVLQIKLTERLREIEGGVYSPSARVSYNKYPVGRYTITIAFGCAPDNVDKLIKATEDEITKLQTAGAQQTDIDKFIAEEQRGRENDSKTNAYWLSYLLDQYQNKEDLLQVLSFTDNLKKVTPTTVQQAAKKYSSGQNRIVFKLLPEKGKAGTDTDH